MNGYIDKYGHLLDDYGNELRDNKGRVQIIPKSKRHLYKVLPE